MLATVGVGISAAITTAGMHYFSVWPWATALVFGVLISATDPVSVIATFKEAGVKGRLRLVVEAESLFNDGTAAVGFTVAVALASRGSLTAVQMTTMLLVTTAGGVLCGLAIGGLILLLTWRTEDHLVELTFTTVAAYGAFLLAEHFHFSGVLATLTTGLLLGNLSPMGALSTKAGDAVHVFWEYAALANSFVFLLLGMREAQQQFRAFWFSAVVAVCVVTISRAAAVYPTCLLFSRSQLRMEFTHQHVLVWGGLRGALALALALGLPAEVPQRESILAVSFAVVALSIFVQGLTMKPLLRRGWGNFVLMGSVQSPRVTRAYSTTMTRCPVFSVQEM